MEETIDIKALVLQWAKSKAEENKAKVEWIDLDYSKNKSDKKTQEKYIKKNEENKKFKGTSKIEKENEPKSTGEERIKPEYSKTQTIGGGAKGVEEQEINETITVTHVVSFTKELNAGINLGVFCYADIGLDFDVHLSKTAAITAAKLTSINKKQSFELEKNHTYEIKRLIYETPYIEDVVLEVSLSGEVPVYFNKKVKYPDTASEKHQLQFVPITDIISELKNKNLLPKDLTSEVKGEEAIIKIRGTHEFKTYRAEIEIIENDTVSKSAAENAAQKPIKVVEQNMGKGAIVDAVITMGHVATIAVDLKNEAIEIRREALEASKEYTAKNDMFSGATINQPVTMGDVSTVDYRSIMTSPKEEKLQVLQPVQEQVNSVPKVDLFNHNDVAEKKEKNKGNSSSATANISQIKISENGAFNMGDMYTANKLTVNKSYAPLDRKGIVEEIRSFYKKEYEVIDKKIPTEKAIHLAVIAEGSSKTKEKKKKAEKKEKAETENISLNFVELSEIFKSQKGEKNVDTVIISGEEGIGKTTVCQYIAYQWATEVLFKDKFKLLILLSSQDLIKYGNSNAKVSEIIFRKFFNSKGDVKIEKFVSAFEKIDTNEILYVLDDFDQTQESTTIKDIVSKNLVLTCRSPSFNKNILSTKSVRQLRNIGFFREDIENYINNFFKNLENNSTAKNQVQTSHIPNTPRTQAALLKKFTPRTQALLAQYTPRTQASLIQNPPKSLQMPEQTTETQSDENRRIDELVQLVTRNRQIKIMATNPSSLELICHVWKNDSLLIEDEENVTLTMFYNLFLNNFKASKLGRFNTTIIDKKTMEKNVLDIVFGFLEKFAFDSLNFECSKKSFSHNKSELNSSINQSGKFNESEQPKFDVCIAAYLKNEDCIEHKQAIIKVINEIQSLKGLLKISGADGEQEFHFINLMLQFFSARHISNILKKGEVSKDIEDIIKEKKYNSGYEMVLPFVSGLLKGEKKSLEKFFDILKDEETKDMVGLAHQCLLISCRNEIISSNNEEDAIFFKELNKFISILFNHKMKEPLDILLRHLGSNQIIFNDPRLVKELPGLIQHASEGARAFAADILCGKTGLPTEILESLVTLLKDEDSRESALSALKSQLELPKEIILLLFFLLKENENEKLKYSVAAVLSNQSELDEEILKLFVTFLSGSTQQEMKQLSAKTLNKQITVFSEEIFTMLHKLLKSKDPEDRQYAANALKNQNLGSEESVIGAKIHILLLELLKDRNQEVREAVVDVLSNQTKLSKEVIYFLVSLLNDKNKGVKDSSVKALANQSNLPIEVLKYLIILLKEGGANSGYAAAVLREQSNLPTEIVDFLLNLLKSKDFVPSNIRKFAAETLINQCGLKRSVLKLLGDLLQDKTIDMDLKECSVKVLGNQTKLLAREIKILNDILSGDVFDEKFKKIVLEALKNRSDFIPNDASDNEFNIFTTLVDLIRKGDNDDDDEDDGLSSLAAKVLSKQPKLNRKIIESLVELLKITNEEKSALIARNALIALGDQPTLSDVEIASVMKLLDDTTESDSDSDVDDAINYYALNVLCNRTDFTFTKEILRVLKKFEEPSNNKNSENSKFSEDEDSDYEYSEDVRNFVKKVFQKQSIENMVESFESLELKKDDEEAKFLLRKLVLKSFQENIPIFYDKKGDLFIGSKKVEKFHGEFIVSMFFKKDKLEKDVNFLKSILKGLENFENQDWSQTTRWMLGDDIFKSLNKIKENAKSAMQLQKVSELILKEHKEKKNQEDKKKEELKKKEEMKKKEKEGEELKKQEKEKQKSLIKLEEKCKFSEIEKQSSNSSNDSDDSDDSDNWNYWDYSSYLRSSSSSSSSSEEDKTKMVDLMNRIKKINSSTDIDIALKILVSKKQEKKSGSVDGSALAENILQIINRHIEEEHEILQQINEEQNTMLNTYSSPISQRRYNSSNQSDDLMGERKDDSLKKLDIDSYGPVSKITKNSSTSSSSIEEDNLDVENITKKTSSNK